MFYSHEYCVFTNLYAETIEEAIGKACRLISTGLNMSAYGLSLKIEELAQCIGIIPEYQCQADQLRLLIAVLPVSASKPTAIDLN